MGFAFGIGAIIPISLMIRRWFETGSSTAIAISSAGSSLAKNQTWFSVGGLVFTPLPGMLADMTGNYDLTFIACGLMGSQ